MADTDDLQGDGSTSFPCSLAELDDANPVEAADSDTDFMPVGGEHGDSDTAHGPQPASGPSEAERWTKGVTYIRNRQVFFLKDKQTGLYKCTRCNYKSSYRSSLRSHDASHSNARPYGCEFCEYRAKRSSDLRKHKILKHGKSSVTPRGYQSYQKTGALKHSYDASKVPEEYVENSAHQNSFDAEAVPVPGGVNHKKLLPRAVFPGPQLRDMLIDCESEPLKSAQARDDYMYVKPEPPETYEANHQEQDDFEHDELENLLQSVVTVDQTKSQMSVGDDDDSTSAASNETSPRTSHSQSLQTRNVSGRSMYSATGRQRGMSPAVQHAADPRRMSPSADSLRPHSTGSSPSSIQSPPYSHDGSTVGNRPKQSFHCSHCNILFFDGAIYFMHMGLHNTSHPWQCNLCGERLHDVYSFTSHFINGHNRRVHDD